jgi:hypothetical protein
MDSEIRYADLWALLKRLGFDCDIFGTNPLGGNTVRICEHAPTNTRITLADYPPEQPVHPQVLYGVRLQLDSHGFMTFDEFDRWAKRRAKANAAKQANGAPPTKQARKRRVSGGSAPRRS